MISKFLKGTLLSAVAMVAIIGCGSDSTTKEEAKVSPYQRVAIIPGTKADIQDIALKITDYVVHTDEKAVLGFPSNWVIAGANPHAKETYEGNDDLIPIPVDTGKEVYKSRVIEFCNGPYATQATNTGQQHGSALPCEVAVHSDGENVYVDMLDADAIFSIFFPGIADPNGELKAMAEAVKGEIRGMIMASLNGTTGLKESTEALGPKFTTSDISKIKDEDIYLVTKYKSNSDKVFTTTDAKTLAQTIISKMGTDDVNADVHVDGLSAGSKWRSARPDPIAIPGVFVTEACSPTYAKMATRLGAEYITALPCEITAYLDRTDDTNKTISVSILSPKFMFENMFKGAVENAVRDTNLSQEDAGKYATLASTVLDDLNKIVNKAVTDSGLDLKKAN
jgi:uncharacterized protein (DUF302 family)